MITITGWGAFWLGLFGFMAIDALFSIIKHAINAHTVTKVVEDLSNLGPELAKEIETKVNTK